MKSQPLRSEFLDSQETRLKETRIERDSETKRLEKLRAKLQIQLKAAEYHSARVHPAA